MSKTKQVTLKEIILDGESTHDDEYVTKLEDLIIHMYLDYFKNKNSNSFNKQEV